MQFTSDDSFILGDIVRSPVKQKPVSRAYVRAGVRARTYYEPAEASFWVDTLLWTGMSPKCCLNSLHGVPDLLFILLHALSAPTSHCRSRPPSSPAAAYALV